MSKAGAGRPTRNLKVHFGTYTATVSKGAFCGTIAYYRPYLLTSKIDEVDCKACLKRLISWGSKARAQSFKLKSRKSQARRGFCG